MKKEIYIIFIIYGLAEIITAQKSNGCITPNNEKGVCISIKQCKKLNNLLVNRRHISSVKNLLRKSFCGYDDSIPKLCCPPEHVTRKDGQWTNKPTAIIDPSNPLLSSILPSNKTCGKLMINTVNTDRTIVGRRPAKLGAWPWLVIIGYKSLHKNHTQTHWGCGGSLITNRHVLTAAYCLDDFEELKPTVVRLGDLDLDPTVNDGATPLEILIDSIIAHDRYFDGGKIINNIAVLKLKESVTFNNYIQPICLPSQSNIDYNKMSVVAGWGSIKPSEISNPINPTNTKLTEVELPFIDNTKCKTAYANETRAMIDNTVLCAGFVEGKKDSCPGDIGGPLMLENQSQYYAIGVVSYGPKVCGTPNKPGVYTSVPSFINWILRSLANN